MIAVIHSINICISLQHKKKTAKRYAYVIWEKKENMGRLSPIMFLERCLVFRIVEELKLAGYAAVSCKLNHMYQLDL